MFDMSARPHAVEDRTDDHRRMPAMPDAADGRRSFVHARDLHEVSGDRRNSACASGLLFFAHKAVGNDGARVVSAQRGGPEPSTHRQRAAPRSVESQAQSARSGRAPYSGGGGCAASLQHWRVCAHAVAQCDGSDSQRREHGFVARRQRYEARCVHDGRDGIPSVRGGSDAGHAAAACSRSASHGASSACARKRYCASGS